MQGAVAEAAAAVDVQNGLDLTSMDSLMKAVRVAILQTRAALKRTIYMRSARVGCPRGGHGLE